MKVEDLLIYGKKHIHSDHSKILLAELINKNPLELLNYLNENVDDTTCEQYKKSVSAIESGQPLQYALGYVNFYGLRFYIDKRVLIPRFETEELVENTIEYIKKYFTEPVDIIDLGCGSGAIGLTLETKISTKTVDLVDISSEALEITHKNCGKFNSKANIIQNDFLNGINKKYDVIISNPPYIKTNEKIEEIVKNNEPNIALYAGEDGLDCYKKILSKIKDNMKDKCIVAFEIGYEQKDAIVSLINTYLKDIKIITKKDMSNKDRMIFIFKGIE